MNKSGIYCLIVAAIVSIAFSSLFSGTATAAACSNVSSFGAVSLNAPVLSNIQNQALWIRLQGAQGAKVLVEINEKECHEITLQNEKSNIWTWQSISNGNEPQYVSFPDLKGNTVKLIGVSEGVRLDRVLITEPECTPVDFGNNCRSAIPLTANNDADITAVPSPQSAISGKTNISPTVRGEHENIASVSYSVNGKVIQKASTAVPFDTTLVKNGRHTIHVTTVLKDDRTIREMISVDIENPENALSPLMRWIKLQSSMLKNLGFLILALAVGYIIMKFITDSRRSHRERTFRGL